MHSQRLSYERTLLDLALKLEDCLLYTEVYFRTASAGFSPFKFSRHFLRFESGTGLCFRVFPLTGTLQTYLQYAYGRLVHTRDKTTY